MSYGKMTVPIRIARAQAATDAEGFAKTRFVTLARTRAYQENKHASERWANRAAFSEATALFRFRKIPRLDMGADLFILTPQETFRVLFAEDVRGRGMYAEVLADVIRPSVR